MTMETLDIGPSPCEENAAACGIDPDFREHNLAECRAFVGQIVRALGEPPEGAFLRIKANSHDFGTYREVVCKYDDEDEAATAYAYRCESESPAQWDDIARAELAAAGFPVASPA